MKPEFKPQYIYNIIDLIYINIYIKADDRPGESIPILVLNKVEHT
jgi:hypothetical protein